MIVCIYIYGYICVCLDVYYIYIYTVYICIISFYMFSFIYIYRYVCIYIYIQYICTAFCTYVLTLIASIVKLDILTTFKTYLHDIELHRFGIPCCQRQIRPQKLLAAGHRVHPWCVISFNMVQYCSLESIFYSIQVCLVARPHHMWKNKSNTCLEAAPGNQKRYGFCMFQHDRV